MDLNILLEWFKHYNYVCIPILAFIIDTIIGDPNSKFHPVALIGRVISFMRLYFIKIQIMIQKNFGMVVLQLDLYC